MALMRRLLLLPANANEEDIKASYRDGSGHAVKTWRFDQ